MIECSNNECTFSNYKKHISWAVAFYDRFVKGDDLRRYKLRLHVFCNSLALIGCFLNIMLFNPLVSNKFKNKHKLIGTISLISLLFGILPAMLLSTEHIYVDAYGNYFACIGFLIMGIEVLIPAIKGYIEIKKKNMENHRNWMIRLYGSLWGSFLVFRVIELIVGPFLTNYRGKYMYLGFNPYRVINCRILY